GLRPLPGLAHVVVLDLARGLVRDLGQPAAHHLCRRGNGAPHRDGRALDHFHSLPHDKPPFEIEHRATEENVSPVNPRPTPFSGVPSRTPPGTSRPAWLGPSPVRLPTPCSRRNSGIVQPRETRNLESDSRHTPRTRWPLRVWAPPRPSHAIR